MAFTRMWPMQCSEPGKKGLALGMWNTMIAMFKFLIIWSLSFVSKSWWYNGTFPGVLGLWLTNDTVSHPLCTFLGWASLLLALCSLVSKLPAWLPLPVPALWLLTCHLGWQFDHTNGKPMFFHCNAIAPPWFGHMYTRIESWAHTLLFLGLGKVAATPELAGGAIAHSTGSRTHFPNLDTEYLLKQRRAFTVWAVICPPRVKVVGLWQGEINLHTFQQGPAFTFSTGSHKLGSRSWMWGTQYSWDQS